MDRKKYRDFHIHSTNSDGERTVEEIILAAEKDGVEEIAITDHNCFAITQPMLSHGVKVIPGCEFSTDCDMFDRKVELHITGLFFDGIEEELQGYFSEDPKLEYIKAMIARLNELGMKISLEEFLSSNNACRKLGRLQLADLLVERGYARNREDAMDRWIGNLSPYYLNPADYVTFIGMDDCVRLIRKYQGMPVLAHPFHYGYSRKEIEELTAHFRGITDGKMGIEVYYKKYMTDPSILCFLEELSVKYNLVPIVASDAHKRTDRLMKYKI